MSQPIDVNGPYGKDYDPEILRTAFCTGELPVAVYGLGKMGLPLAAVYAEISGNVIGTDIDSTVVQKLNKGECHIKREPGLKELVSKIVKDNAFYAIAEPSIAAKRASIHVVIVPTPITDEHEPDLSILNAVITDIGAELTKGDIVIVECTVPPQTCMTYVLPQLTEQSGLSQEEFGLAFCPERTASGRALNDIRGAYPKIVGGVDAESRKIAKIIYEEINDQGVITVSDTTTAEAVKVFEGLYRDVNIALANELATFTDELNINVNEAIEVANTQPYCNIHTPGPGVGGHCIPFYPYFMIKPFETDSPLLKTARKVNDSMPGFTVRKLRMEFKAEGISLSETKILLLGLTYRPGVEEVRASPAIPIADDLATSGADVYGIDPILDEFNAFNLTPIHQENIYSMKFDGIILITPHEEFESIQWDALERENGQLVVIDGRDSLKLEETDHRLYTIGQGWGKMFN